MLLRQAHSSLSKAASKAGNVEPRYFAEANWWLGHSLFSSALHGPGDFNSASISLDDKSMYELNVMVAHEQANEAAKQELASRFQVWVQSTTFFAKAAGHAKDHWKTEWPVLAIDGLRTRWELAEKLRGFHRFAPQLDRSAILADVVTEAEDLLELARNNPDMVGPDIAESARAILIEARSELLPAASGGSP